MDEHLRRLCVAAILCVAASAIFSHDLHAQTSTLRGDANADSVLSVSDVFYVINYVFAGGAAPLRSCLGDANHDQGVTVADALYLLSHLFGTGPQPPQLAETCNSEDDDCDGQIDDGVGATFYRDADADTYGTSADSVQACAVPAGYVSQSGDCNDGNPAVFPGATETCNALDDNCDGSTDPGCLCIPGTGSCNGASGSYCSSDGMALLQETCDPLQGMTCNGSTGRCEGACSPTALATLGRSNVGCDFYPTVTLNPVDPRFSFAAAVVNATQNAATVTVTRGSTTVQTPIYINPNVFFLPWDLTLKGPGITSPQSFSVRVNDGAYRVRSTQPVIVYQFNPFEDEIPAGGGTSGSNDASLLLPAHTWGRSYFVGARQHLDSLATSGFYAVTAREDQTVLQITGRGNIKTGAGLPSSGSGSVTLNEGDVLEVVTDSGGDVTGTLIEADKPVQVIGGHQCAQVPEGVPFCDHLEESLLPTAALGTSYVIAAPRIPTDSESSPKVSRVRVIATEPSTALSFEPLVPGAPTAIETEGQFVEFEHSAAARITATKPILVLEYMTGYDAGGNAGDPSMVLTPPTSQWRSDYTFFAPTNYATNYINIIAPAGSSVLLDGAAVTTFLPVGTSGYVVARPALSNSGFGIHSISATTPVGITVYGYPQVSLAGSYWYTGGTNMSD